MNRKITIAIDGYSSCGKSTMARALARRIGYVYIDTGAMYRAVTLYCLRSGLYLGGKLDVAALEKVIGGINITLTHDAATGGIITMLNGENVEREIRTMEVSSHVSEVASLPFVRTALTEQQRAIGRDGGVVMDGRDIGTTVFPKAELKIFVTASAAVRARRRYLELQAKGEKADYDAILRNVEQRDYIDTHREVSPLRQAPDAVVLDNSELTPEQQDAWLLARYNEAIEQK